MDGFLAKQNAADRQQAHSLKSNALDAGVSILSTKVTSQCRPVDRTLVSIGGMSGLARDGAGRGLVPAKGCGEELADAAE